MKYLAIFFQNNDTYKSCTNRQARMYSSNFFVYGILNICELNAFI